MPRVLLIGLDPEHASLDEPGAGHACAPGKVRQSVRSALREMQERGWSAVHCAIRPDETAGARIEHVLAQASYDCVVIGTGLRLSRHHGWVFEAVINAVHRLAPQASIAFGSRAEDSVEVAARWLPA